MGRLVSLKCSKGKVYGQMTYNTLPPPNSGRKVVVVLVPMPSVRSTNKAVNSPYTMSISGVPSDLRNVNMMPRHISHLSSVDAYRY